MDHALVHDFLDHLFTRRFSLQMLFVIANLVRGITAPATQESSRAMVGRVMVNASIFGRKGIIIAALFANDRMGFSYVISVTPWMSAHDSVPELVSLLRSAGLSSGLGGPSLGRLDSLQGFFITVRYWRYITILCFSMTIETLSRNPGARLRFCVPISLTLKEWG